MMLQGVYFFIWPFRARFLDLSHVSIIWLHLDVCLYGFDLCQHIHIASQSFNINYPPMRTLLCPGDIITYTCTFGSSSSSVATRWTGSGFQCSTPGVAPNTIGLSQDQGAPLNTVPGTCGNLSAVMTNISGTCYTSVLTIPTPQYFNGTTVTCRDGNFGTLIGNDTLNIKLECKYVYVHTCITHNLYCINVVG